mgnify:FL=1
MNEFKDNYNDLKNNFNTENSKLISFLIYGIILGRLLEKYKKFRKKMKFRK